MKKYISFFRLRLVMGLQYRAAALAGVTTQFFWGFMEIIALRAFYESDPSAYPMTLDETCSYIWLQQAFLVLLSARIFDGEILNAIQSGNIAYEFCRPVHIYDMWFAKSTATRLSGAWLRCIPVLLVVFILPEPYGNKATKAGLTVKVNQLEAHYLAGGDVDRVVNALIAAQRAGMDLSFEKASAIDLAGRNVFEAVKMSVTPKVVETPLISAVAKDGIELLVKARVTVRTNIERLIGGAGEATVLARIGEGIVTTVGSSKSHDEVLENPDEISKLILEKGLDSGTAYEIISIDIADIDIGRNVGANLQSLQAEADNKIAQARAEERRAMAVALEQEMRAAVVQAEAEIPKAMAQALREGHIGVVDYYKLQNVLADTDMKKSIGTGADAYAESKKV